MKIPFVGEFKTYKYGKETELDYCDVAIFTSQKRIKNRRFISEVEQL